MTSPGGVLLVTGAAGKTGLAFLRALARRPGNAPTVRALARGPSQRAALEQAGADETVIADLGDPATLEPAFRGLDAAYHICPNVHPHEVAIGRALVELARAAGARRFVFHSVLQPRVREMPHHWRKAAVEDFLRRSGLDFTILQPAPYMQNVLGQRTSVIEKGVFRVPYELGTRVSMVDLEDVAEAAARVVSEPGHSGATYELCAPGLLDQREIAGELGRALGRTVRAEVIDRTVWAASARSAGLAEDEIDVLLAMFRYYERHGMTGSGRALEELLDRPPSTFARFARRAFASAGSATAGDPSRGG